jgi:DNA-binding NtrC family response regulator
MTIELPSLRTIPEDIPALTDQFLRETCLELGRPIPEITPEVYAIMQAQPWPGNIRELRNTIRRIALFADRSIDEICLIDCNVAERSPTATLPATRKATTDAALPLAMHAVERWALLRALDAAAGRKMVAARLLEMNYYTFRRRLARFGLDSDQL